MLLIAILKHAPEHCLARSENAEAREAILKHSANIEELEKKTGVKMLGAYVCPNEHTFYFILETDDYQGVRDFLGNEMLTHHTAKITPVTRMKRPE